MSSNTYLRRYDRFDVLVMQTSLFAKRYPQSFLLNKPLAGALILFLFSILFTLLYHPLNVQRSFYFGFEATMLIYGAVTAVAALVSMVMLKQIPYFRKEVKWTLSREILFIFLVLLLMGITIFLLGFAMEERDVTNRWNISTFLDSLKHAVLIYILPFAFFSLINARFLFLDFRSTVDTLREKGNQELMVHIDSSLKKESLDFQAGELVYAMADGNYVMFHLFRDSTIKRIPIRNSISDIEDQLKNIPIFYRCHRGFIINLLKVESKSGNASGYTLKLQHHSDRVPVARNRVQEFDQLFSMFRS